MECFAIVGKISLLRKGKEAALRIPSGNQR
jgi:hypothetical protein